MAVYYVDSDNGSDANGGTDPLTDAWQTFNKVQNTAIPRGSTVYLRRCDNYYDTDLNDGFNSYSGTLVYHTWDYIIGDDGSYGITEWVSDSTTVVVGNTGGSFALNLTNRALDFGFEFRNIQFHMPNYDYTLRLKCGQIQFTNCTFRGDTSWDARQMREYVAYVEDGGTGPLIFDGCAFEDFDESLFRCIYAGKQFIMRNCTFLNCRRLWDINGGNFSAIVEDSTVHVTDMMIRWNGDYGPDKLDVVFRRCEISGDSGVGIKEIMHDETYLKGEVYTSLGYSWHTDDYRYVNYGDQQEVVFEDINGVPGPCMRAGNQWVAIYDSTTSATLRTGGGDSVIKFRSWHMNGITDYPSMLADSTHRILLSKWEFDLPEANGATEYTATVYCMADGGWGDDVIGGTGNKLYLEVDYLSGSDGEGLVTKSRVQSTQDISADDTWTAFSVNFTPSRAGKAVARVWVSDYYSGTAFCYLDNFLDVVEA